MDEITIPYHLVIPIIICIVGLGTIFFLRKKLFPRNKVLWISVTVFLFFYLLIVAGAAYDDLYCQWDLNRYDLNKDGLFSGQEITEKQTAAMQRLTNDVGRNLSFITGFIFAFIISSVVYIMGLLFTKFKKYNNEKI
jgi:tetrahydromethanopterin S-methyltransferase subunit G